MLILLVLRNLALGLGAFVLIILTIAFRIVAIRTPSPRPGESKRTAGRRLDRAFLAQLRIIFSSMQFWAIAAIITAAIIAGTVISAQP